MKSFKSLLLLIILFFLAVSCDGLKTAKSIFETSERIKYERSFKGSDSLMNQWKTNYSLARNSRLTIEDGFSADVLPDSISLHAFGYGIELKKGDLLIIETVRNYSEPKIFVDVIAENSTVDSSQSYLIKDNRFAKLIENSGLHKVIIQPEIKCNGNFKLRIYTQPSLGFPVAGKGNWDVQSFWGASRDGGNRNHEGVDIFAAKGTPVVAVANGFVTRTGNQGLGGKQVWLRDSSSGDAYYYAHLDSILTESGKQVSINDTIGLVGNTGNAAGGLPHLHFGIYTSSDAVDPYPYIRKRDVPKVINVINKTNRIETTIKAKSKIYSGLGEKYEVIQKINTKTKAKILAVSGKWVHIKTFDGNEGFILKERLD